MKKHFIYIAALAVLLVSCKKETIEHAQLELVAKEVNKKAPMQIDQFTMLDSAALKDDFTLVYYYTIIGSDKDSLDFDVNDVKMQLIKQAQLGIDTLKAMQSFESQVGFKYMYRDKNGNDLFDYTVKTKNKQK